MLCHARAPVFEAALSVRIVSGCSLSVDEAVCEFQGRWKHVLRMGKFKRAGDGMRVEMCCCPCCGYTFYYFFSCDNLRDTSQNIPGVSNYSNVVNYMADKVIPEGSEWTHLFCDNLYSSAPLLAAQYTKRRLVTATTRTSSQQWPKEATQKKLQGKHAEAARGTLLQFKPTPGAAQLSDSAQNVRAISYFDQGPVHMLTTARDKARMVKVCPCSQVLSSLYYLSISTILCCRRSQIVRMFPIRKATGAIARLSF
jgi:hypothetical protein